MADGLVATSHGLAESHVKRRSGEDLRIEEVLALLSHSEARTEVYKLAQQSVAALILKEDISWLDIPVKDCILLQETYCLGQLLKDGNVLEKSKVVLVVILVVCYFSEEISRLEPCHYGPLGYSFNPSFVDIEIVFANIRALQVAVEY